MALSKIIGIQRKFMTSFITSIRSGYLLPYTPLIPAQKKIVSALWNNVVIEKADLKWLNLEKLCADFPSRVQVLDETVNFVGPVRIIFPLTASQIFSNRCIATGVVGLLCLPLGFFATLVFLRPHLDEESVREYFKNKRNIDQLHRAYAGVISLIFSLASAMIFFRLATKVITGQPSIEFFQKPIIRLR